MAALSEDVEWWLSLSERKQLLHYDSYFHSLSGLSYTVCHTTYIPKDCQLLSQDLAKLQVESCVFGALSKRRASGTVVQGLLIYYFPLNSSDLLKTFHLGTF